MVTIAIFRSSKYLTGFKFLRIKANFSEMKSQAYYFTELTLTRIKRAKRSQNSF